jgi:hypothetical protein
LYRMKAMTPTHKDTNMISTSIQSVSIVEFGTTYQYTKDLRVEDEAGGLRWEVDGFNTFGTS